MHKNLMFNVRHCLKDALATDIHSLEKLKEKFTNKLYYKKVLLLGFTINVYMYTSDYRCCWCL